MAFCSKCGTESRASDKFCSKCGSQHNETKDKSGSKKGVFFIVAIVAMIGFGYYFFVGSGAVTGVPKQGFSNNQALEKCPYECCNQGDYELKSCLRNYECSSNHCIEIDSDNDGLSDIKEGELGTNPQLYDTDGDTLNDYVEVNTGTNPLDRNSDGDRYDDNKDKEPLLKNTAVISLELTNKEFNWDIVNIGMAAMGIGLINPDMVIATPSATIKISNTGDDYTSHVRFDVNFKVQNEIVGREKVSLNRISKFDSLTGNYNQEITVRNIPDLLLDLIKNGNKDWEIVVENLEYEKF